MIRTDGNRTIANAPKRTRTVLLGYTDPLTYSLVVEVKDGERIVRHRSYVTANGSQRERMESIFRMTGNRVEQRIGKLGGERLACFIDTNGEWCRIGGSGVPATAGWVR